MYYRPSIVIVIIVFDSYHVFDSNTRPYYVIRVPILCKKEKKPILKHIFILYKILYQRHDNTLY